MKRSRIVLCGMIWSVACCFACVGASVVLASQEKDKRWSLVFESCSLSDALSQVTRATGIDVFTNRDKDKPLLSRSYKDRTIDEILRDLFRKENCAMVWCYGHEGLEAVGIWIFEGSGSGARFDATKFLKDRRASLRGAGAVRNDNFKSIVVEKRAQEDAQNRNFSVQGRSETPGPQSQEPTTSQHGKPSTGWGQSKSSGSGSSGSNREKWERAPLLPSPKLDADSGTIPVPPPLPVPEQVASSGTSEPDVGRPQGEDQGSGAGPGPPPPVPEKWHGLEPPPMPPGLSYNK